MPSLPEYVGYSGTGTFTQPVGANIAGTLYLGYNAGAFAKYSLSTSGLLSAASEYVGDSGAGTLSQSGGSNSATTLVVSSQGCYQLGGGTLQVNGSFTVNGSQSYESAGWLSTANAYVGYSTTGTSAGTFTQSGGTSNFANQLVLGAAAGDSGTYYLSGAATLSASAEYVGLGGAGNFSQSGGTNRISNTLYLADSLASAGTYTLNGPGVLSAVNEFIGTSGTGVFNHSRGTNSVEYALYVGYNSGGAGSAYNLSGSAILSAAAEFIGYESPGTFTQSGGTNVVAVRLTSARPASTI